MEYTGGAARFLTGTPNVPAHYAATPGYDLIEEVGRLQKARRPVKHEGRQHG